MSDSRRDNLTYEASKAETSNWGQPDKISWKKELAYRDSPYRLLHHQQGIIGHFRVQLLEACDLQRSYWSALALGPLKHLGLSKAQGPVSSYVEISIEAKDRSMTPTGTLSSHSPADYSTIPHQMQDSKPSAKIRSPIVPNQNNPKWNNCEWKIPLHKGLQDGNRIYLSLQATEDSSAAESLGLPFIPSLDDRLLGVGELDITQLCFGDVTVFDEWVDISKHNKSTGRIRLIISYRPQGENPREHDLVALEAFARRSNSSCPTILPPLQPMKVLKVHGFFLLIQYTMRNGEKATIRLNRNVLFVIERTNLVDATLNLALLPTDFLLSTPIGRQVSPFLDATGELVMPAILSAKLMWSAFRTTGMAALTGVTATVQAVLNESNQTHNQRRQQQSFREPIHASV